MKVVGRGPTRGEARGRRKRGAGARGSGGTAVAAVTFLCSPSPLEKGGGA